MTRFQRALLEQLASGPKTRSQLRRHLLTTSSGLSKALNVMRANHWVTWAIRKSQQCGEDVYEITGDGREALGRGVWRTV